MPNKNDLACGGIIANIISTKMFSRKNLKLAFFCVLLGICLVSFPGNSFSQTGSGEQDLDLARSDFRSSADLDRYLDAAEKQILAGSFDEARQSLKNILKADNGNNRAKKMLERLDFEEAEQEAEKTSFWSRLFSSFRRGSSAKGDNKNFVKYMDKSRLSLGEEKFAPAREYAMKAFQISGGNEESRALLTEIDTKEGLFRQKHSIPSEWARTVRATSAEDYQYEREKFDTRQKLEELALRKNIIGARRYLDEGEYESARKITRNAWKEMPHDTEVSIMMADINKAMMLGPEGLKTDAHEGEFLISHDIPLEKDPMTRHEEGMSLPDIIPLVFEGIGGLFSEKRFTAEHAYPSGRYSMDDCVEIALNRSQRMIFADEQVKLGEMRIWEIRRKLFPDLSIKAERSSGKIGDPGGDPGSARDYEGEKFSVDVKQTVFDGFSTYFEIQQAQTNLDVIKTERDRIRNEIIAETKRAYYNLDKAVRAAVIQDILADRVVGLYDMTAGAYREGLVAEMEYLKVKGQKMQVEFQQVSSRRDTDLARLVLAQAMNIDPDEAFEIEPMEVPEDFLNVGLQNCYNLALANNPDLKTKEQTIAYYEFERKMAKARGWPKIDFMGSFGRAVENFDPVLSTDVRGKRSLESEWYAGLTASIPLWGSTLEYNHVREQWAPTVSAYRGTETKTDYFTLKILDDMGFFTSVQETRVGFERAKYEYQKAKNDIGMQIKSAYYKYRRSLLQMDVARSQLEHQQMFVEVVEQRSRLGDFNISTVIEEYIKLSEHKYGEIHGYTDYYMSVMELNSIIGVMGYFDPWKTNFEARQSVPGDLIAEYLSLAREELDRGNFKESRKLAAKAAEINSEDNQIRKFLGMVDQTEALARETKSFRRGRRR